MKFARVWGSLLLACLVLAGGTDAFRIPGIAFRLGDSPSAPPFCHELECPKFQTESDLSRDTELRSYSKVSWVSTVVQGPSLDVAIGQGFMRLYKYITGKNEDKAKIDMTAPVRLRMNQGDLFAPSDANSYTISFFLSNNFTAENPAPTPTDKRVFVESEGATDYFIKSYGGWSSELIFRAQVADLMQQMDDLGMSYDNSSVMYAGYDSPFRIFGRHNEVWVKAVSMS